MTGIRISRAEGLFFFVDERVCLYSSIIAVTKKPEFDTWLCYLPLLGLEKNNIEIRNVKKKLRILSLIYKAVWEAIRKDTR